MGWSAGGHLTNKLITFTNRFKAASSSAGAANWTSLYAQTDTRANRAVWFGGTPWQRNAPIDTFWAQSPLEGRGERHDADAVLRRAGGSARADAAIGGDVPRASSSHGVADEAVRGAARGTSVGRAAASGDEGESRARLVRASCDRARRYTLEAGTGRHGRYGSASKPALIRPEFDTYVKAFTK